MGFAVEVGVPTTVTAEQGCNRKTQEVKVFGWVMGPLNLGSIRLEERMKRPECFHNRIDECPEQLQCLVALPVKPSIFFAAFFFFFFTMD